MITDLQADVLGVAGRWFKDLEIEVLQSYSAEPTTTYLSCFWAFFGLGSRW